jgi:hypothetical protein
MLRLIRTNLEVGILATKLSELVPSLANIKVVNFLSTFLKFEDES